MEIITIIAYFIGIVFVVAAVIYKKYLDMKSNIPTPGIFFMRLKNRKTFHDLKNFAEENNAGLVHVIHELQSYVFITHPDTAQQILRDEETFQKDPGGFSVIGGLMRKSLVNTNGDTYRTTKDVIGPAFHFEFVVQMVPFFLRKAEELFDTWANNGKDIEVRSDMSHFTLDTLGLAAFGVDFKSITTGANHEYLKAYNTLIKFGGAPKKEEKQAVATLSRMTDEIIKSKLESQTGAGEEHDILDRLLTGMDRLSADAVKDNVFLMFIAGHETTAHALEWALYFLAKYPEMQKRATDEVDSVLKGELPDAESVKSLPYIDMFIKETLRFRPPVANIMSRITVKDTQVGQYFVPKNTRVALSMYTMHHLKEFWEEPEKFDPLRFTPERSVGRHPFAYMPFSLGKRNCIGNNFSLLEQKLFIAMVLQRYTITVSDKCIPVDYPIVQVCWPCSMKLNVTPRGVYVKRASTSSSA